MKGKIIFSDSPDSYEAPCPFCIQLNQVYEKFEKNLPFEFIPQKIDIKQDDVRINIALSVAEKLGKKGQLFAPILVNDGRAVAATRGSKYFEGMFRRIFKKWLLFG